MIFVAGQEEAKISINYRTMKKDLKKHLLSRVKLSVFILSLVGWFLPVTVFLEKILKKDLSALEQTLESGSFKWGIKIVVIIILVLMIKGETGISTILATNKMASIIMKTIVAGGIVGWIIGLGSLLF